jgi:hypothetical protein
MLNKYTIYENYVALKITKKSGVVLEFHIDIVDLPRLQSLGKSWCAFWSETAKTWYVYHKEKSIGYHSVLLHRFLMNPPEGLHVDHIDHDGLNNRRYNLRNVTRTVNQLNNRKQTNNTSGYRGVVWDKDRNLFQAKIKLHGKQKMLGRYKTAEEANDVVVKYRKDVLGCFA